MQFGIDIIIKAGKIDEGDGSQLDNKDMIKPVAPKEGYKYLGV